MRVAIRIAPPRGKRGEWSFKLTSGTREEPTSTRGHGPTLREAMEAALMVAEQRSDELLSRERESEAAKSRGHEEYLTGLIAAYEERKPQADK